MNYVASGDTIALYLCAILLCMLLLYLTRARGAILAYTSIVLVSLQYALSPILSLSTGGWTSRLIQDPMYVDVALEYASFSILAIILGYIFRVLSESGPVRQSGSLLNEIRQLERFAQPSIICGTLLTSLLCFIVFHLLVFGDLTNILEATGGRAFGQFQEKSLALQMGYAFNGLSTVLGAVSAVLLAFLTANRGRPIIVSAFPVLFVLIMASVPLFYKYSRISGMNFALFVMFFAVATKKRTHLLGFLAVLVPLSIYLSLIGYSHRAQNGILLYISDVIAPRLELVETFISNDTTFFGVAGVNLFDSSASFSAHAYFSQGLEREKNPVLTFLLLLQPVPLSLLGLSGGLGASLSQAMGTYGSTGITTPTLADMYFLFGYWSIVPLFFFGMLLRRADYKLMKGGNLLSVLVVLLLFGAVLVSGHSGIRATARPAVLALFLTILNGRAFRINHVRIRF